MLLKTTTNAGTTYNHHRPLPTLRTVVVLTLFSFAAVLLLQQPTNNNDSGIFYGVGVSAVALRIPTVTKVLGDIAKHTIESGKRKVEKDLIRPLRRLGNKVRGHLFQLIALGLGARGERGEPQKRPEEVYDELLDLFNKRYTDKQTLENFLKEHLSAQILGDPDVVDNLLAPRILRALKSDKNDVNIKSLAEVVFNALQELPGVRKELNEIIQDILDYNFHVPENADRVKLAHRIQRIFLRQLSALDKNANAYNSTMCSAIRAELAEHLNAKSRYTYRWMVSGLIITFGDEKGAAVRWDKTVYPATVVANKMNTAFERIVAERKAIADSFQLDSREVPQLLEVLLRKGTENNGAELAPFREALITLNRLDPEVFRDYIKWDEMSYNCAPEVLKALQTLAAVKLQKGVNNLLKFPAYLTLFDSRKYPRTVSVEEQQKDLLPVVSRVMALITSEFYQRFGNSITGMFVVKVAAVFETDFHRRLELRLERFDPLVRELQAVLVDHLSAGFLDKYRDIGAYGARGVLDQWFQMLAELDIWGREAIVLTGDFLDQWTLQNHWLFERKEKEEMDQKQNGKVQNTANDDEEKVKEKDVEAEEAKNRRYELQKYGNEVVPGLHGLATLLWTLPDQDKRIRLLQTIRGHIARGASMSILLSEVIDGALIGWETRDVLYAALGLFKPQTKKENDAGRLFLRHRIVPGWDSRSAEFLSNELARALDWFPRLETLFSIREPSNPRERRFPEATAMFLVFGAFSDTQRSEMLRYFETKDSDFLRTASFFGFKWRFERCIFDQPLIPFLTQNNGSGGINADEAGKKSRFTVADLISQIDHAVVGEVEEGGQKAVVVQQRFAEFKQTIQKNPVFFDCLIKKEKVMEIKGNN